MNNWLDNPEKYEPTPKKIWANFSTSDVEKTRKFYKELGFRINKK